MSADDMRTNHSVAIMTYITTRVHSALVDRVRTLRVDVVKFTPTPQFPSRIAFQVEYTGDAVPQEILDCVASGGQIGYHVMARQWTEEIGKR